MKIPHHTFHQWKADLDSYLNMKALSSKYEHDAPEWYDQMMQEKREHLAKQFNLLPPKHRWMAEIYLEKHE